MTSIFESLVSAFVRLETSRETNEMKKIKQSLLGLAVRFQLVNSINIALLCANAAVDFTPDVLGQLVNAAT